MITTVPVTHQNAAVFKAVRLRALEEAPYAFSSTYASESKFSDEEWFARVERMNGERGVGFIAMDGHSPCGLVGCFLDQNDPSRGHLVSMWTDPRYRRQSVGRLLVEAAIQWANERSARRLTLMVTGNNEGATRFYEKLGFSATGRAEPYPNDPMVVEYEMERPVP